MKTDIDVISEISTLNPIRVETALSRYPIHRLAKKGDIDIDIHEKDGKGETVLKWRVTYNSGFGQPGPLAYRLDTLIINRRIEEASRPLPKIIRLGSLRDICRELGLNEGKATQDIKNALHQNASAYITAKTRFRLIDGTEDKIELGDTRYAVIFTGQTLPDGRKADAVYIELHDRYREILDRAITRPLDYDYLKSLPPAPQRFYEILSYQMYAALKYDRSRAKLTYSELCTHAPQKRHVEWDKVRSQMNKVHRPHKTSGYIAKVDFHQTTDSSGQPDWIMNYMPGPRARAEFLTFTKRGRASVIEIEPIPFEPLPLFDTVPGDPLEAGLIQRGVSAKIAAELSQRFPAEFIARKIEEFDWEMKQAKPPKKPAGYLVKSIQDGYTTDPNFETPAEVQRKEEARKATKQAEIEASRRKRAEDAAERMLAGQVISYRNSRTPKEMAQIETDAIAQASDEIKKSLNDATMKSFRKTQITLLINDHIAMLIKTGQVIVEPA